MAFLSSTLMPLHLGCHKLTEGSASECLLSIDVGTSGTKACLVSSSGRVLISGFSSHPAPTQSIVGGPLSAEQDQESWWLATVHAIQSCIFSSRLHQLGVGLSCIRGIAVTGQMQDVIMLPKPGLDLRSKAILYSDARAALELHEIAGLVGGAAHLTAVTGTRQGASSVLGKLRWIDKYSEIAADSCGAVLFGGHDYITWKLCGSHVTDVTTVSTTGLTDSSFEYAYGLLEKAQLGHWISRLPEICPADVPCGEVTAEASEELGCSELKGLPVFHTCGDAGACTLGAGAARPGPSYAYLGTSGWVAGSFQSQQNQGHCAPGVFRLGHPDPSLVFKTGSVMTAGGNLAWAAENLTAGISLVEINKLAASASPGCSGLLYLPFINGERCPIEDPNFRAAFIGISTSTSQADMLRAVMEGVAFAMRSAEEAMTGEKLDVPAPLRLVGGGARSTLWPLIMAAVFGRTVEVLTDSQDVGVKGAAVLAGKWLGWHSDLSPGGSWLDVKLSYEPCSSDTVAYGDLYMAYCQASKALEHVFTRLSHRK